MSKAMGLLTMLAAVTAGGAAPPADTLYTQAQGFYDEFTWDRAIELFDRFVASYPDDPRVPEAEFKALDARYRLDQFDDFEAKLADFIARRRNTVWGARGTLVQARFLSERYGWREMERAASLYAEALRQYRAAVGRRPFDAAEKRIYCDMLLEAAGFFTDWRDPQNRSRDVAAEHYQSVLQYNLDDDMNARAWLGIALLRMQRFDDREGAEQALLTVIRELPRAEVADEALYTLASYNEQQGNYVLARTRYLELRRRYPRSEYEDDAAERTKNIEAPRLSLMVSRSHLPGARIPTRISTRNIKGVQFAAYRVDLERLLTQGEAARNDITRMIATGEKLYTWHAAVADQGDYQPLQQRLDSPMREAGLFIVEARADGHPDLVQYAMVNVSSLVLVQEYAARKLTCYVASRTTRQPVPEAQVTILRGRRDVPEKVAGGATDADGLFITEIPNLERNDDRYLIGLASLGDEVALVDGGLYVWWQAPQRSLSTYVYTDRPVYRPENTVHFKAILRTEFEGEFETVAAKPVRVTINDARGEELYQQTLTSDAYGTVGGELTLAEEPALGVYSIRLEVEGQAGGGQFRVEEYRKPEYEVKVGSPLAEVRPGGAAAVPVDAKYYFGAPVADAEVKYVVQRRPYRAYYWFPRRYDWFYAGWHDDGWYPYWRQEVVAEGTTKTDAQGRAVVEFVTTRDGSDYVYSIHAEVADVTRRVVDSTGSLTVTQKGFYLYANANQGLYAPDDDVTLTVKAETADHAPVATGVSVDLWKMRWIEEQRDPVSREIKVYAHYERESRVWQGRRLETDPNSGEETLTFDAPADGYYELALSAPDTFDPNAEVTTVASFWTASDAWKGRNYNHANLQLVTEKDLYEKGEVCRMLVNAPVPNGAILLTIGAEQVYSTRVVRFDSPSFVLDLPIADNYAPNVYFSATLVAARQVYFTNKELMVPPTDRFIAVKVESDAAEYKPRTTGRFILTTADQNGRPVPAQVSLGITDESVYAIQEEMASPIGVHFYGRRRGLAIQRALSWEGGGEYDEDFEDKVEAEATSGGLGAAGMEGGARFRRGGEMPAPAAAPMEAAADAAPGGGAGGEEPIAIREFFPDTILWQPTVTTDADGRAEVTVEFPDSLTTWRATARAITTDTMVGQQVERVITSKDLIVRLQAPRFFTQLDRCTISLVVTNRTSRRQEVATQLAVEGLELAGDPRETVVLEPNGQARVDREVVATTPGTATITVTARGPEDSDGVKMTYAVLPHGADKFAAAAGRVDDGGNAVFELELPAERREDATKLTVSVAPSLGTALLDALPYLIEYPYGCAEQTTSKFIPCVLTARVLGYTGGTPGAGRPAQVPDWWRSRGLAALPDMVKEGLTRLAAMQNADGGYGWFGGMRSDLWMTAYVGYGLLQAKLADFAVPDTMLGPAMQHLANNLHLTRSRYDTTAYLLWVLGEARAQGVFEPSAEQQRALEDAFQRVYAQRDELNEYTRALLILALLEKGERDKAEVVWRNLQARRIETEHGVHWGERRWGWWWSEDQVETTSFALLAAMKVEPESPLVDKAVQWLVVNRSGNRWHSTKDTATALLALSTYMDEHDELRSSYSATLLVNGQEVKGWEVTPQNALTFEGKVEVDPGLLRSGANRIEVKRDGAGALYYSAMLEYYTKEDPITAAGNLMSAERDYFRVVAYTDPEDSVRKERLEPIADGAEIASGEQIEVAVTIDAENEFDYVAFRDPKPAGCEPVDQTSGGTWGGTYLYRELRDEEVTFFADHLPQGKTTIRYRLRAESPGVFRALPHNGFAMYRPDVRCLSDEAIVRVGERPASDA